MKEIMNEKQWQHFMPQFDRRGQQTDASSQYWFAWDCVELLYHRALVACKQLCRFIFCRG